MPRTARRHARAFTLVEILVVVAILAIVAGLVVATGDPDERASVEREARRLAGAIEYAASRAQWQSQPLGVSAGEGTWRFWVREEDRWRPVGDDAALAAHALPPTLEARIVTYAAREVEPGAIIPLRASGRNQPFTLVLSSPSWRATLAADPLNRVTITAPEPSSR